MMQKIDTLRKFFKPNAFKVLVLLIVIFPIKLLFGFLLIVWTSAISIFGYSIFLVEFICVLFFGYAIACILERIRWYLPFAKNEFIRPTSIKVLLTAIISVLTIFLRAFANTTGSSAIKWLECLFSPLLLIQLLQTSSQYRHDVLITMSDIFLGLAFLLFQWMYWYLMASWIVWIFEKSKKRSGQ
ncbi:MAG: hypothetical protein ABIJ41_00695 [Candidatus Omnitrophota bacterium]